MAQVYLGTATDLGTLASLDTVDFVIDRGNQNVTGTLNQSALATGIANVYWGESATPTIMGTDGSAFQAKVTGNFLIKGPGGRLFYSPTATTAKLQNIGATRVSLGTGTLTNCENGGQGDMTIGESCVVTNLRCVGGSVTEGYNATVNTIVTVGGGSLVSERAFTTGYLGVGSWTFGRSDGSVTGIAGGTLYAGGGSFRARGAVGAFTAIHGWGDAYFDFRECTQALTISALNITKEVRDRSYFVSKYATITISATVVYGAEKQTVNQ